MRSRGGGLGSAPADYEAQDEPPPEVPAPKKLMMGCHLAQVKWTKAHFETLKCSIIEFSTDFIHINQVRGLSVTRRSVVGYWNQLVWSLYGESNPTCNRLESQVSSPPKHKLESQLMTDHVYSVRLTSPAFTNFASTADCLTVPARATGKTGPFDRADVKSLSARIGNGLAYSSWKHALVSPPRPTIIGRS